jgi:hypothetical protein
MPRNVARAFSARRHVNRKIFRFSLSIGIVATVLTSVVFIASVHRSLTQSQKINRRSISEIDCNPTGCDSTALSTDWDVSDVDYIIDSQTRYVLSVQSYAAGNTVHFKPLDYTDTEFIAGFRQPATYKAPNGEVWRLFSLTSNANNKEFEIIVGYGEKVPWKMIDSPQSMIWIVDAKLKQEADAIVANLQAGKVDFHGVRADGFEIVDKETHEVLAWGPWLPMYLPKNVDLPKPGWHFYSWDGDLYVAQTDTDGRLYATTLVTVGGLLWLVLLACFAFLSASVVTWAFCRQYLRGYFALRGVQTPTLAEALRSGEGQTVEFKRGLSDVDARGNKSDAEFAESVTAFANTNDGAIFLGVDDDGHVKGLQLNYKLKDRLEQKLRQLIRNHIQPAPPVQVSFEELGGLCVAKITVARGDAPLYMMNGRIYIRSGSSDVLARPEDVVRLFTVW